MTIQKVTVNETTQQNQNCSEKGFLVAVRAEMRKVLNTFPSNLEGYAILEHLYHSNGKMLRAKLAFRTAKLLGDEKSVLSALIKTAAAIELIHLASLVHDDVMDGASTRRGSETINHRWDSRAAVICGDLLISEAVKKVVFLGNTLLSELFARTAFKMSYGQLLEFSLREKVISLEEYLKIASGKTGSLFGLSLSIATVLMDAYKEELYKAGVDLGIAFQINDDLIDVLDQKNSGKGTFIDFKNGIFNYPAVLIAEKLSLTDYENFRKTFETPEDFIKRIQSEGILKATESAVSSYLKKAEKRLKEQFGDRYFVLLEEFYKYFVGKEG